MISYVVQAGAILIFGPILACFALAWEVDLTVTLANRKTGFFKSVVDLSSNVNQGNIFVSLAVLVASVIRCVRIPPPAELESIKLLARYQTLMALAVWISQFAIFGLHRRVYILGIYYLAVNVLAIVVAPVNGFPSSKATALQQIAEYCFIERDYPLPLFAINKDRGENRFTAIFLASCIGVIILFTVSTYFRLEVLFHTNQSKGL